MPGSASSISREIATLRKSLKAMDRSLRSLVPRLRMAGRQAPEAVQARVPRKLRLSPERQAQLKIQGKYMATMRQLKPKQKVEVRNLLRKKGMRAAVARAQRLMKNETAA